MRAVIAEPIAALRRVAMHHDDGMQLTRVVRCFAWLPTRIDGQWMWWTSYLAHQEIDEGGGFNGSAWIEVSRERLS